MIRFVRRETTGSARRRRPEVLLAKHPFCTSPRNEGGSLPQMVTGVAFQAFTSADASLGRLPIWSAEIVVDEPLRC
jgi:hypothetical protein